MTNSFIERFRPFLVEAENVRGDSWSVIGYAKDDKALFFTACRQLSREYADECARALNGDAPASGEPLSTQQADAFLEAVTPKGDCGLPMTTHVRTYLGALGPVPVSLFVSEEYRASMANVLRRLADAIQKGHA